MTFRKFLICLAIMLTSTAALTQYRLQHFTTENGLPSNGIKGMEWDESTGFLWTATEAGLVRYNGMGFKTFDINTNPEIGSNRIVTLVKNAGGKILMSGQEGNLSVVKKNTVELYFKGSQFAKYDFTHYGAIGASDTLFRQCFKNPWKYFDYSTADTRIMMLSDTASVLFNAKELYYYSITTSEPELVNSSVRNINSAFEITRQLYYLDSLDHFFSFDLYKGHVRLQELFNEEGKKFIIQPGKCKLLWQGGMEFPVFLQQGKAWIIERKNNHQLQFRLIAAGLPEDVQFIYAQFDKVGDYLFLGSASQGLYIVHSTQLISKQPAAKNINQSNSFYSQLELPDGNIITNQGIIIGNATKENDYGIGKTFVNSVYDLNDSLKVFGYWDSIFVYNKNTYRKQLMFKKNVNLNFTLASTYNNLYFADQDGIAIVKNNNSLNFLKIFNKEMAIGLNLRSMIQIAPNKLGLATCEGLLSFNTDTKELDTLLKVPNVCFRTLYKDGDYIFIGTYGGGFYIMKNGKLKAMPLDINQYLKYTHCFIKDSNGYYWISTNNGLFKVRLNDLIEAYEKDIKKIYYHHFGREDGMEITEMNGGCTPCVLQLKSGIFSFPTMKGLLWLDPLKTKISLPAGEIYLDNIRAGGKEINVAQETSNFPQHIKKVDLTFAINAWCKKENLYIDYKLNDDRWLPVDILSGEVSISLANLSYGTYKLVIRKINGFGVNNHSFYTYSFKIKTPFYHQWWFRILLLLAFFGIGYLVFKWRLHQYAVREKKLSALVDEKTIDLFKKNQELEKGNRIKMRLISIINHDIMTPLKFMHYAGKALVENKGTIKPEKQMETLAEITQTAKDMEMLSSQILNWIIYQRPNERMEKEEFNLHQMVEMIFRVLQFSAKEKQTLLQNDIPQNYVVYQYLEPLRVMIYNLVLNSLNFTRNGKVSVSCDDSGSIITLRVNDTGLGMKKEQIDNLLRDEKIVASVNVDNRKGTGLGYLIIKDLLEIMKGTLEIRSKTNEGTTVSIQLPAS